MFESIKFALKNNRKSVFRKTAALFLFGLIILVMGLWGVNKSGQQGMSQGTAVTVNGHAVPMARYQETVERLRRDPRMQQYEQLGGDFGAKMMQSQALSQVVEMELVRQKAEHERILTTNEEVADTIRQIPAFQENGVFKRDIYQNYLAQTGKSSSEFETEIRSEQALRRTVELFRAALAPTPLELDLEKSLSDKKANVEFLRLPNDALIAPSTIKTAEATEWLSKPENDRKVKDYFDSHKKDYSQQEQVRARHILIKAVEGDKESENRAFTKAQDLEKQLKSGADFAALAKKNSDDPGSKDKGGDLGFFARGSMVPAFEKVAFSAKSGEVSAPVKTEFGYHIIQVQEKKAASERKYDDAKTEIAQTIIARDRSHEAVAQIEKELKTADASKTVATLASSRGLKWEESGTFNMQAESVPKVGESDDAVRTAFALTPAKPLADHLVRQGPNAYILRYKTPAAVAEKKSPEKDNPQLVAAFQANRRSEDALRGWVEGLRKSSSITVSDSVTAGMAGGSGGGGGSPFDDN
jgi:peptidyl-prolyl cis-trans isomerase D